MSEAIILYRGRGGVDPERLKPTTITNNGIYEAPVTGTYRVSCVGGGGGGGGGCRNSWNSSQVFYGAGGTRGSLTTTNVTLNAGDKIQVNLGAGGVGGVNNTIVVSNNSRGTNGSAGGTTTFGSLVSGAGGTYGAWSWHYHWKSSILVWEGWRATGLKDNYYYMALHGPSNFPIVGKWYINVRFPQLNASNKNTWMTIPTFLVLNSAKGITLDTNVYFYHARLSRGGYIYDSTWGYSYLSHMVYGYSAENANLNYSKYFVANYRMISRMHEAYYETYMAPEGKGLGISDKFCNNSSDAYAGIMKLINRLDKNTDPSEAQGSNYTPIYSTWTYRGNSSYFEVTTLANVSIAYNPVWNNQIYNTTTRCYTSIQQGSWWYTSANNVTTSGTRTYRGDGGNSGRAGNAGFVLVIPPTT